MRQVIGGYPMSPDEKLNHLIFSELERFGECDAHKPHYNHDYYAHKDGWTKFLESGSRFPNMPLPEKPGHEVRIVKSYPDWYIEQEARRLEEEKIEAETESVPF